MSAANGSMQSAWTDPSVAARYANAENATAPFAKLLVSKANWDGEVNVFDLATGTGVVVKEIYDAIPKENWGHIKVLGGDVSQPMLSYLQKRGEDAGWTGLETKIVDGNDMRNLPKDFFTHVLCTFGIFMLPNALAGLYEVTKSGGFVGVTTWKSLAWMNLVNQCISRISGSPYNPTTAEVEEKLFAGKAWGDEEFVAKQLRDVGFEKVETEVLKIVAKVGSPEMFVESMQFPLKMIVAAFWPEDKRDEYLKELNEIMLQEVAQQAEATGGVTEQGFEGILAWGWKA